MELVLQSEAFGAGGDIPARHSKRGENVSPPLFWSEPPERTLSFALIMQDLDTPLGKLTHWVLYNIPGSSRSLAPAFPPGPGLPDGTVQGPNGLGRRSYLGPSPPWGRHRYVFTLYALDVPIAPGGPLSARGLERAMGGHILARGELTGRFGKARAGRKG